MDSLSLGDSATHAATTATVQVRVQLEPQSPTLVQHDHHQLVHLSDMAEITERIHDEIVSIPKEILLISLVSQEPALYNPKHEYYRNTQRKDAKWLGIADNVGWSETQCKSKWKAMRDQYCRELKRSKFNAKANVKWKYFKELEFLRPFALSRNYRPRTINTANKTNNSTGNMSNSAIANNNKFAGLKVQTGQYITCEFNRHGDVIEVHKNESAQGTRLITTLTDEQLNSVIQQNGSWNYLTTTTSTRSTDIRDIPDGQNAGGLDEDNLIQPVEHEPQQTGTEDMICALVESVTAAAVAGQLQPQQSTQLNQLNQQQQITEEEEEDPIHTFLNMESFFEKDLIAMIQQDDILYNSYHPSYRNAKLKLEVWDEIARKLKKPVRRCRLKWKALRDQYIREHKRLKDREDAELLPRWKHYDALCFLQKFIKHKTDSFDDKNIIQITKSEMDDMDDPLIDGSPLENESVEVSVVTHELHQQTLPSLSGPHTQHQLHATTHDQHNLCVVAGNSVSGYDEMDIDHYIIGNGSDNVANDDVIDEDDIEVEDDVDEDHKSQQHFAEYTANSTNNTIVNELSSPPDNKVELEGDVEYKEVKCDVNTQDDIMVIQQQQQQVTTSTQHQLLSHEQQQQHLLAIEVAEEHGATLATTDESLIQQHHHHQQQEQQHHSYSNEMQQSVNTHTHAMLSGGGTVNNNNSAIGGNCGVTIMNSNSGLGGLDGLPLSALVGSVSGTSPTATATTTTVASANGLAAPIIPNCGTATGASPASQEDDEVGAFFKAVAMKIRSAKMPPVAFTDLQIDILRVINDTLRNY